MSAALSLCFGLYMLLNKALCIALLKPQAVIQSSRRISDHTFECNGSVSAPQEDVCEIRDEFLPDPLSLPVTAYGNAKDLIAGQTANADDLAAIYIEKIVFRFLGPCSAVVFARLRDL